MANLHLTCYQTLVFTTKTRGTAFQAVLTHLRKMNELARCKIATEEEIEFPRMTDVPTHSNLNPLIDDDDEWISRQVVAKPKEYEFFMCAGRNHPYGKSSLSTLFEGFIALRLNKDCCMPYWTPLDRLYHGANEDEFYKAASHFATENDDYTVGESVFIKTEARTDIPDNLVATYEGELRDQELFFDWAEGAKAVMPHLAKMNRLLSASNGEKPDGLAVSLERHDCRVYISRLNDEKLPAEILELSMREATLNDYPCFEMDYDNLDRDQPELYSFITKDQHRT